jgi:integrase
VTLNQARVTAQKVFAAKLDGRDLAAEKKDARRRMVADSVDDLLEAFIAQHVSQNRSAPEISRMLRREVGSAWGSRSIHEISKRDVIDVVSAIEQRGAPVAANKALKAIKTFFRWCIGRAVLDRSPADGVPLPAKQVTRDRVLDDSELAKIILAARQIGAPYGDIVEILALTGQRREEVARCTWDEIDLKTRTWKLSSGRTKNAKSHEVHLSDPVMEVLNRANKRHKFIFSRAGDSSFQGFSSAKREIDELSGVTGWRLHDLRRTCVSGMARLGIAPHVADKILNHQAGTISGVAAVYQRHDFLAERKEALETWGAHVRRIIGNAFETHVLRRVA